MQPTKQPLITIEGKDCKYEDISDELTCIRGNLIATDYAIGLKGNTNLSQFKIDDCPKCKEGKSPTKLIFDADDFQEEYYDHEIDYEHESSRIAKRYLLSKKEDIRYLCPKCGIVGIPHPYNHCKKFRLSSDAVLKSIGDKIKEGCHCAGGDCEICQLVTMINNHNLLESSKIVIVEGYYE